MDKRRKLVWLSLIIYIIGMSVIGISLDSWLFWWILMISIVLYIFAIRTGLYLD